MRLSAYNKELEAATAYAAAVHVVKDGKRVLGTVELTDEEKGMLEGCTLSAVKRLVRGRQWFRWTEWETALVECPEEETAGDGEEHSDSQDDDAGDAAGCAVEEGDEEIELEGEGLGDAEGTAGQGTPHELNEDAAAAMGEVVACDEEVGSDGEGEAAPVISKAVASVMAEETSAAKGKAATAPPKPVPDNPFAAMPCGSAQPASGSRREEAVADDVFVISRAELEALKTVRDDGERRIARLEALLLVANDPKTQNKRPRDPRGERAHGDARPSKHRRRESGSEDATSEEGEKDDAEVEPVRARRVVRRRHMTVSSSPILQEAFDFMPSGKAWKKTCDHVREYLFIERANDVMTFYPRSHDKTLGLCWVTPRLTMNYAGLALAADKARYADLNKALSQWKTEVTGRVRDIALPCIGLWRNERDRKSPWARKKLREAADVRLRYRLLDDVNGTRRDVTIQG
ncbi:unnamed protein product [Closterium sp. NIES-64]|nr:unnamed protein product [Closterium sp. NIES-64]